MEKFYQSGQGRSFFEIVRSVFVGPDSNLQQTATGTPSFEAAFNKLMEEWDPARGVPDLLVHINSHGSLDGVATCSKSTKTRSTIPNETLAKVLVQNVDRMQQAGKRFRLRVIQDTCFAGGLLEEIKKEIAGAKTRIDIDVRTAAPAFRVAYLDDIRFMIEAAEMAQAELKNVDSALLEGDRGWEWFARLHRNIRTTTGYDAIRDLRMDAKPLPIETYEFMLDMFIRRGSQLPGLSENMQPMQMMFEALSDGRYPMEDVLRVLDTIEENLKRKPESPPWAAKTRFDAIRELASGNFDKTMKLLTESETFPARDRARILSDALRFFPGRSDIHMQIFKTMSEETILKLVLSNPDFFYRGHVARFIDTLATIDPERYLLMSILSGDSSAFRKFVQENPQYGEAAIKKLRMVLNATIEMEEKLETKRFIGTDFTLGHIRDVQKHSQVALKGVTLDPAAFNHLRGFIERDPERALTQIKSFGINDPRALALVSTEEFAIRLLVEGKRIGAFHGGDWLEWFQSNINEHVDDLLESELYANSLLRRLENAKTVKEASEVAWAFERISKLANIRARYPEDKVLDLLFQAAGKNYPELMDMVLKGIDGLSEADQLRLIRILVRDPNVNDEQLKVIAQLAKKIPKEEMRRLIAGTSFQERNRARQVRIARGCAGEFARIGGKTLRAIGLTGAAVLGVSLLAVVADQMASGSLGVRDFAIETLDDWIHGERREPAQVPRQE